MAATSAPYGLKPQGRNGTHYVGVRRTYVVTTNNTTGIFYGDPVSINSGVITTLAATPTTTRTVNSPVGIFVGCEYTDPSAGGGVRSAQFLPAASVTAGYTGIKVYVEDDPGITFHVQADGALTIAAIGKNAALKNFGAGSTTTGNSKVQLDSGSVNTTITLAVKIIDVVNPTYNGGLFSVPGDAYTDVVCLWNAGVHIYQNGTGA